jgi:hypothetical protein
MTRRPRLAQRRSGADLVVGAPVGTAAERSRATELPVSALRAARCVDAVLSVRLFAGVGQALLDPCRHRA